MRFEVADVAEVLLAGLWHRGPYERISDTFATLFPRLAVLGLDDLPDSRLVSVYYDDPAVTPDDELRSFAAVTIAESASTGDLHEVRLPGGRFLRGEFIGPHEQIPEAWQLLNDRLAEGPYTARAGASYEVYARNDEGAPDDRLRTDLYRPVA